MPAARPLAFYIHSVRSGLGAEKVVLNVVSGLAGRGHEIDLLLEDAEGDLSERLPAGVNLEDLGPHTHKPAIEALLSSLLLLIHTSHRPNASSYGRAPYRILLHRSLFKHPTP